jgi:hypothetical protein
VVVVRQAPPRPQQQQKSRYPFHLQKRGMMIQDAVPKERHQIVDIDQITKRLGVRLTKTEFEMLQQKVDANGDGQVSLWE